MHEYKQETIENLKSDIPEKATVMNVVIWMAVIFIRTSNSEPPDDIPSDIFFKIILTTCNLLMRYYIYF